MKTINRVYIEAKQEYEQLSEKSSFTKLAEKYKIDRHKLSEVIQSDYYNGFRIEKGNDFIFFDDKELKSIELYENDLSVTFADIKRIFGYKSDTFKRKLEALGYSTEKRYQKNFNREAFKNIETEEDAYWLGFLLADGYLNDDRKFLTLKLGAKDKNHLIKFCNYMKADPEINIKDDVGGSNNPIFFVNFCSVTLVENLQSHNIFNNKSCKEIPDLTIKPNLIKHYIRGIIDGDGSLTRGDKRIFSVCGSLSICQYVRDYINNNIIPLEFNYIYEHGKIFRMWLGKKEIVEKCYRHFYENASIYLDRKYEIAKEYLNGRE